MKKTILYALAIGLATSACQQDFLNLSPKAAYTDNTYFQTDAQFRQAVTAAYAPLLDLMNNDFYVSEMRSDNTFYQSALANRGTAFVFRENISDFKDGATNSYTAAEWQYLYQLISRANIVIDRLEGASGLSTASVNSYDGQCKFLRAFAYFRLVRLFGGVPLFIHEVKEANGAFQARATVEQVYQQIIEDATDAIRELNTPAKFPQTGEATRGSATVLLADVLLTRQRWAEAETLLTTLPAMGYGLNTEYSNAFLPANKNSKESLFEVQYLDGTTTGTTPNTLTFNFLPRSTNTALLTGTAINSSGAGGVNTPTPDLISAYEPGDKRLDASIGIAEGTYNASNLFTFSAVKSVVGYAAPPTGRVAVPYIKKYVHAPLTAITGSADNFPIYRYAEALLLLAEAQNEQGKSPLAALNAVRNRAGLSNAQASDQATLRQLIGHERRVELAFENKRWYDLIRSGTAVATLNAFGEKIKAQASYLPADSRLVTPFRLLFPIPAAEVGLNPLLTQNPGY